MFNRLISITFSAILLSSSGCGSSRSFYDVTLPYAAREISLPPELAEPELQVSGLCFKGNDLLLMPENRADQKTERRLYSISSRELKKSLLDSTYTPAFAKVVLTHLDVLANKIKRTANFFEGLEAIAVSGSTVYLAAETKPGSKDCFVFRGKWKDAQVTLDTNFIFTLPKPLMKGNKEVPNAGFEAIEVIDNKLYCFFEYNGFGDDNPVYVIDQLNEATPVISIRVMKDIPFRLTDVTSVKKNTFVGPNFFFRGNDDSVYRPKAGSPTESIVKTAQSYQSYSRLIEISTADSPYVYRPFGELPERYHAYNWEGLAKHHGGFFLINDKYTSGKSKTTLLFLERTKVKH